MALYDSSQGSVNLSGSGSSESAPCASQPSRTAASSSACLACCTSGSAPRSAPVSTRVSNNSSEASCGLFPKHVSAMCTGHCSGLDASAHTPRGASMVVVGFKALRPPDKEVGSYTAMVARSAIQGRCVREWLLVWVCSGAGACVCVSVCMCFLVCECECVWCSHRTLRSQ